MASVIMNNLIFLIYGLMLFKFITVRGVVKKRDLLLILSIIVSVSIPLTIFLQKEILFKYISTSSNQSTLLAPIEELTKLIPVIYILLTKYKTKNVTIGDYIYTGAFSSIIFTVIENIMYGRKAYISEIFTGTISSYMDFSILFSHITSTVLTYTLIGIIVVKCKTLKNKLLVGILTCFIFIYQTLEHMFTNYVLDHSILGLIEYTNSSMFGYGFFHNLLGKNEFTAMVLILLIVCSWFIDKNINLKNKENIKEIFTKLKNNKKQIIKTGLITIAFISIFIMSSYYKGYVYNEYMLGGLIHRLLEDPAVKTLFCAAIAIGAICLGGAAGFGIACSLVKPLVVSFSETKTGKHIRSMIGDKAYNVIARTIIGASTAVGLISGCNALLGASNMYASLGATSALIGEVIGIAQDLNTTLRNPEGYMDECIKDNQGLATYITALAAIVAIGGCVRPLKPEVNSASKLMEIVEGAPDYLLTLDEISNMNTDDFKYKTMADEWENARVDRMTQVVGDIYDKKQNSITVAGSLVGNSNSISDEKLILLGITEMAKGKGKEYKVNKDTKIKYNEKLGLAVIIHNDEIVDVQRFPKAFLQLATHQIKDNVNIETLIKKNSNDITDNDVLMLLTYLRDNKLDNLHRITVKEYLQKLNTENPYVFQSLNYNLISEINSILEPYSENNTLMGKNYKINKMNSLANSEEAEVTRTYLEYCLNILEANNNYYVSNDYTNEINDKLKKYEESKNGIIGKILDPPLSYRFIPQYK